MSVPVSSKHPLSRAAMLVAAVTLALILLPTGLVHASGDDGTVRGTIRDAGSQASVAGATVELSASDVSWVFEAVTDAGGAYSLAVPNHRYTARVSSPDYAVSETTVDVGSGLTVWNNMSLTPVTGRTARLQGYVTDRGTSTPISIGRIVAAPPYWASGPIYENASALDAAGYYAMDLVPNTYVASTDGISNYTPYSSSYLYLSPGETLWLNISLDPDPVVAWINGTVVDADTYTVLANATVTATLDGLQPGSTTTDASGRFSLAVPTGSILVTADAAGHAPGTSTVYVYGAGTYMPTFYLTPLSSGVRGVVRDGVTGAPLRGVLVVATPIFSDGYFDAAQSDASGSYAIALPRDDYTLTATLAGYASWYSYAFLFGGVSWINVTLWPIVSTLQGYVVDGTTGFHLPAVYVYAYDSRSGYSAFTTSDGTGFYSIALTPSPAIVVRVTGAPPYAGTMVYPTTRPYATTWANLTIPRLSATVRATVTDGQTGLPLSGAYVGVSWVFGSSSGLTDLAGVATVGAPEGLGLYVSAGALGYFPGYATAPPISGTYAVDIALNPVLTANVTVRGYVRDASTNASITFATVHASGYDGYAPWDYTDGTGYYSLDLVPWPQTIRATAYGYAEGVASVDPAPGSTIWVNLSLPRDSTTPRTLSFTATPSAGLGPSNPTALEAAVNETNLGRATVSILMLQSAAGNVGTFLNLGSLSPSTVSVAPTTPGNVSVSTSWDTRTPVARLSDGTATAWWPAIPSAYPYQVVVSGYWDNATLASPTTGAAYFDVRTGALLYVYTTYGYITAADQPASTFTPYGSGLRLDLTTAAIVGASLVTGPAFRLGGLGIGVAPAVPGGSYAAFLEAWDTGGNYGWAAVLLLVASDTTPPTANAGADRTVDQGASVTFDGSSSTDNTGVVNWTWTFADGTARVLYGPTATYVFANAGAFLVTLTVRDAAGYADADTLTVTVRDIAAPTVSIVSPTEAANVSGTVSLSATASDNVGVVRVEFFVDGVSVGNATTAPYTRLLDTRTLANGAHTITVHATDAAGNSAASTVQVTVYNTPGGTGGGPLGLDATLGIVLLFALAAAALGVVLLLMRRRRPRAPTTTPVTDGSGGPSQP